MAHSPNDINTDKSLSPVGTNRYFRRIATDMGLKAVFVDCTKLECLEAAITPETKVIK